MLSLDAVLSDCLGHARASSGTKTDPDAVADSLPPTIGLGDARRSRRPISLFFLPHSLLSLVGGQIGHTECAFLMARGFARRSVSGHPAKVVTSCPQCVTVCVKQTAGDLMPTLPKSCIGFCRLSRILPMRKICGEYRRKRHGSDRQQGTEMAHYGRANLRGIQVPVPWRWCSRDVMSPRCCY